MGEVIAEPDNDLLNYEEPLLSPPINHSRILPYLETLLTDGHTEEPWSRLLFLDHEYFIYSGPESMPPVSTTAPRPSIPG